MIELRLLGLVLTLAASSACWGGSLAFDRTPYGLLFAEITVDGQPVRAMIDFGDPHALQLATSFLDTHAISAEPTGQQAMYADGTTFDLLEGEVDQVEIGGVMLESLRFGSSPGEIDAVAEQVGTPFQAAVGWGFFGPRRFLLDYAQSRFELGLEACPADALAVVSRVPGSSYLIIEGALGEQPLRFLIDTGSPLNAVHASFFEADGWPGQVVQIEHLMGKVPGRALLLGLGGWQHSAEFELRDLSVLEPLGVQAILGAPFLESVRLCHEPTTGQLHLSNQG